MTQTKNYKHEVYDLEERTLQFAEQVNEYVRILPRNIPNNENGKQLVRAAGSVGANYIEANESLSGKDFAYRVKIAKKEAKESRYWMRLTRPSNEQKDIQTVLTNEALELMKILGSILKKASGK